MRASWIEVARFHAVSGSGAREARDWFVLEKLGTHKPPMWMDEGLGTFMVEDRTFRIWIGGLNSDWWVVEELIETRSKHA